ISQPVNTPLTIGRITYYFRTTFTAPTNANISGFQISHFFDDGAVVYLNGQEAYRYNMPGGTPTYDALASPGISGPPPELGPSSFPTTNMYPGVNVLAVEVHQSAPGSGDIFMGLKLEAILLTNSPAVAGLVINEVLANNATLEEGDGFKPDWVEIYNPSTNTVDIFDMSLSDVVATPRRWAF